MNRNSLTTHDGNRSRLRKGVVALVSTVVGAGIVLIARLGGVHTGRALALLVAIGVVGGLLKIATLGVARERLPVMEDEVRWAEGQSRNEMYPLI